MPTFAELIKPADQATINQRILDLLELSGFPVSSWEPGSVPIVLINAFSEVMAEAWFAVAQIARGGVLGLSEGDWLEQLAEGSYSETKKPATTTLGMVTLTDHGSGPHTFSANTLTVATDGGLKYLITSGGTLPLNSSLTVPVKAQGPGKAYNVPMGTITTMVSTLPTVTVNNGDYASTGTWVTSAGTDLESDSALTVRLNNKWGTLSTGSPPSAYITWALKYGPGTSRVKLDDKNPDGPGSLRVYIDNAADVAAVQAAIQPGSGGGLAPAGSGVNVFAATVNTIDLPITVYVEKGFKSQAQAEVTANLTALAEAIDIGGIVYKEIVSREVTTASHVINVTFSGAWAGTPDIQLLSSQIPAFNLIPATFVEI